MKRISAYVMQAGKSAVSHALCVREFPVCGGGASSTHHIHVQAPRRPACRHFQVDAEKCRIASTSPPKANGSVAARDGDLGVATCRKLCENGQVTEAVDELDRLVQRGCHITCHTFYIVLKMCILHKDFVLSRRVHGLSVKCGYEGNQYLATHLIGLYAAHGSLGEAMQVFSKATPPSAHNWASIIFACSKHGQPNQAIELYRQMQESNVKPNNRIFVAVLKACASAGDLAAGKAVHAHVLASAAKPDIFVQNSTVHMYAKCGSIKDARRVFERLANKDVVTWNAMIAGYAHQGMGSEALCLYDSMQQQGITAPSRVTFVSLLQACGSVGAAALAQGRRLHLQIAEQGLQADLVLGNSLVNMYAKCGSLEDAERVFYGLSQRNVVTWTALIAGYAHAGKGQEALAVYTSMQREGITPPNSVTFTCLLQACGSVGMAALHQGKQLHVQIEEQGLCGDVLVGNNIVNMYAKCGSLEDAHIVFDSLDQKNVVTWTAMIAGYAQQGMGRAALTLYSRMLQEGITLPNSVTYVCLLQACASAAALPLGKQLHAEIEEQGFLASVAVGPSLVNMYAKCGELEDAQQVFDSLPKREIEAWGALVTGYARQGNSEVVFDLVDRMRLEGIQPDSITFLSVLTVCSHVGLVDKGRQYFEAMTTHYGISPTFEHYSCMMDLLGRAGHLEEALQVVKSMPFQPDNVVWLTLLGACRKWNNVEVGKQAFELALSLDQKDSAAYVLMSSIYAGAEMWDAANEIQARRKTLGVWKRPGHSLWTGLDGVMHSFVAGEKKR